MGKLEITPPSTDSYTLNNDAMLSWLLLGPSCDVCHGRSVVLIRIQYPDEEARHYCTRCRPFTFIVERHD